MIRSRLKIVFLIVVLSLAVALTPVLAQEGGEAPPATSDAAQPVAAADCWLPVLLMGVGAIFVIGAREWWKEGGARYFGGKESPQ